jgi:hypothetical protein
VLLKRIVIALVILLLCLFAAAFIFLALHGRALVTAELERVSGKKVTLQGVQPAFPATLLLEGILIDGIAKIPQAVVEADAGALLTGKLRIAYIRIDSPEINIDLSVLSAGKYVTGDAAQAAAPVLAADTVLIPTAVKPSETVNSPVIDRIKINNAVVMFQAPATGKTWIFDNVTADLKHFALSRQGVRTDFIISGSLGRMNVPFVGNLAHAHGWLNWAARDMNANVEVTDEEGHLGLSAVIASAANDCEVRGRLRLTPSQHTQASGKKPKMIEATVLELLGSLKTDISSDFSFHTQMDHFDIGKVNVSGIIMTGLQSQEISGSIMGSLKHAGEKILEKDKGLLIKPLK